MGALRRIFRAFFSFHYCLLQFHTTVCVFVSIDNVHKVNDDNEYCKDDENIALSGMERD